MDMIESGSCSAGGIGCFIPSSCSFMLPIPIFSLKSQAKDTTDDR